MFKEFKTETVEI